MNTPLRIALAAAAVLVVAVLGLNFIPRQGGVGGPTVTASPSPILSLAPSATPSPSPSASRGALRAPQDMDISLSPGAYQVAAPFAVPFTISFPTSWTPKSLTVGDASFAKVDPSTGNTMWVTLDLIDGVFADPCNSGSGPAKAPKTVAGVVQALTHMVGFTAGPVTDVLVGGHPAKHVVIKNAINTDTAGCTQGPMLPIWTFRGGSATGAGTNGGLTEELWIVDVGGTILVIDGETSDTTTAADRLEPRTIVASVTFQP